MPTPACQPQTFGQWLQCHKLLRHPLERDFRADTLGIGTPQQIQDFLEEDFSDPCDLLSYMNDWSRQHGGGLPCDGAIDGAMRCWVTWREHEAQTEKWRAWEATETRTGRFAS